MEHDVEHVEQTSMLKTPRRAIARGYRLIDSPFGLTASRILSILLSFGSAPILARSLGADGRGVTAAILATMAVVPLVVAGGLPLSVRRLAHEHGQAQTLRAARCLSLATTPICIALALVYESFVLGDLDAPTRLAGFLAISLAPLTICLLCDQSIAVLQGQYAKVALLQVGQQALFVLGILLFVIANALTVALVIFLFAGAGACMVVVSRLTTGVSWFGPVASLRRVALTSTRFFSASAAEAASNRADQVVMLPLIGATQSGLYSVAATVSAAPIALGHAIGIALYAHVGAHKRGEVSGPELGRYLRSGITGGIVSLAAIAVTAPWMVPLVFGPGFSDAILPTIISSVGSVSIITVYVGTAYLVSYGRAKGLTIVHLAGMVVNLGLLISLRDFGAVGASIASSIGITTSLVVLLYIGKVDLTDAVPGRQSFRETASLVFARRRYLAE